MSNRLDRAHRFFPVLLGVITLLGVGALLVWDDFPQLFPSRTHDILAALTLAMIAIAYLAYQIAHRPSATDLLKAAVLAAAFLFWAANQMWSTSPHATLFNDIAIALFVLDVFCVIAGWPSTSPDKSFAETYTDAAEKPEPQESHPGSA
jgi:UDP-N-acetylmuramyl pentapeptide phosphotransferase/UDP-N-acetylglucosamine-1-phosphate transferase